MKQVCSTQNILNIIDVKYTQYNRCRLPRLVVEDDRSEEKPIAGQACDNNAEEDWKKLQYKRGITENQRGMLRSLFYQL